MEFKELKELLERNRSYRRFKQEERISREILAELASLACLCASGRNLQPLKYRLVEEAGECDSVFPLLGWAGYLADWCGPAEGERPAAYIVQCLDRGLTSDPMCDEGLQLEAITLGAVSRGFGSCIVKSFDRKELARILELPEDIEPRHVIALGVPAEEVRLEPMKDGDCRYWRDERGIHHVPKRGACEILLN